MRADGDEVHAGRGWRRDGWLGVAPAERRTRWHARVQTATPVVRIDEERAIRMLFAKNPGPF